MQKKINMYAFVPLPKILGFEQSMIQDVIPLVNAGPTRGGRILSQVLLKHEEGRYLWMVNIETLGGSWYDQHVALALGKLKSLAVTYSTYSLLLLRSDSRESNSAEGFDKNFPIGSLGSTVRRYQIMPRTDRNQEWFEQEMKDKVMPQVDLHPPTRVGHSTDSQMLLKMEGLEDDRYEWLISRTIYEPFKDRDFFPGDIKNALAEFDSLGKITGFDDFQVLYFAGEAGFRE